MNWCQKEGRANLTIPNMKDKETVKETYSDEELSGQESILEELYLTEGGKLIKVEIPSRMDKKTANNIVLRLNAVLNGLNK